MTNVEEKKKLVKELEDNFKKLDAERLYTHPDQKDTKDWLADVAAIFKNLDESDYQAFQNHRQHLHSSIPRETRKHAAEQLDSFTREKVAAWKRYRFVDVSTPSTLYIKKEHIEGFKNKNEGFNYQKLVSLLNELNSNVAAGHQYSSSMLIRAILDHIPPLLGFSTFDEVVSNYSWQRTDKIYMKQLLDFKNEADDALHRQISKNQDLLEMDSLPKSNRINRLLQECLANGLSQPVAKQAKPAQSKPEAPIQKLEIKILKSKVSWASYANDFPSFTWSSFKIDLEIDNYNNPQPDYVSFALKASGNEGVWEAEKFIFLGTRTDDWKPNQPYPIDAKQLKRVSIFISDTEVGSGGQRLMPDFDTDTLELIVTTRGGQNQVIPIKAGWITNG